MMRFFLFYCVWICAFSLQAQKLLWQQSFGGQQPDMAQTAVLTTDGGIAVAGMIASHGQSQDIWLLKLDKDGKNIWQQTYGRGFEETVKELIVTPDGGFLLVGTIWEDAKKARIWVIKTDEWGRIQWEKRFGTGKHVEEGLAASVGLGGGYLIGGALRSREQQFWIAKISDLGEMEWEKTWNGMSVTEVTTIEHKSYVIAGKTQADKLRILRLTPTGFPEWDISLTATSLEDLKIAENTIFVAITSSEFPNAICNIAISSKGKEHWRQVQNTSMGSSISKSIGLLQNQAYFLSEGDAATPPKMGKISPKKKSKYTNLEKCLPENFKPVSLLPVSSTKFLIYGTTYQHEDANLWIGCMEGLAK